MASITCTKCNKSYQVTNDLGGRFDTQNEYAFICRECNTIPANISARRR